MYKDVCLPIEFQSLQGKVSYVQRKSNMEYSSTCPQCYGTVHSDGEWPDRFVMLLRSSTTGGPFAFCRMCDYKWFPGRVAGNEVSPETIALLEQQAEAYRNRKSKERQDKLAAFTTGELWAELHRRMQDEQRQWWIDNGIPVNWQDYLRLGYMSEKTYTNHSGELVKAPAYTIPYFHENWQFITMQYRLVGADDQDRYRFETNLGTSYYMVTPSMPIGKKVVVCEGAKKAIVSAIYGGTQDMTFLGIPSKVDWRKNGILEAVEHCERVWIILDPDCWTPPQNAKAGWKPEPVAFAEAVGNRARIVDLPNKVDDAILKMGLTTEEFQASLRYARRL